MATPIGTLLGRYQIKAEIGRGAMGVVYRARDPRIDRTVAIKTVSLAGLEQHAEHEFRERFVVEARAAGRLSHPGIVTVFDVAEDEQSHTPYLVMEYIEGKSLDQVLSREARRLSLSNALRLAQEIAEALHYAHSQGVIHRDIKPANILVTGEGHAKIADFGVAKLNQTQMTMQGQVLGSPAYMAPEQLSDEGVDARSDLFSLGVVLYFMLTGQKPFQGNSIATVCFRLANHEPLPVATYDMSFPPELDLIVSRAIAKDPARRYQSGEEMARDLQQLRESCGFLKTTESTLGSTSRRLVEARATSTSTANAKPPADPMANTGIRDATRALRSVAITRIHVLALVLVVAGVMFVVFSRAYKSERAADNVVPAGPGTQPANVSGSATPAVTPAPAAVAPSAPAPVRATAAPRTHAAARPLTAAHPPATARLAAAAPPLPADAKLRLEIEHPFTDASATVWLDNELVYNEALHSETRRRMVLFKASHGYEAQNFNLPSGTHQVKVRIQSATAGFDQSETLAVDLDPKGEKILNVSCDKKHNLLQLTLQ
jgi:eukaryotic-like serine/threonine-protein kinase